MSSLQETIFKLHFIVGYVYISLTIMGVILNTYVIIRLIQLAINDYDKFKRGSGLPLAAMSISDLCSLVSIITFVISGGFLPPNSFSVEVRHAHCKISTYLIHTLTGFSTWCWLVISALRYFAVYHPLWHVRNNAFGLKLITSMLITMLLLNSWLPVVVFYYPPTWSCEEQALSAGPHWNRALHGFEILWSYVLPAILTLALDVKVILVRPPSFGKTPLQQKLNGQRPRVSNISVENEVFPPPSSKLLRLLLCGSCCIQQGTMLDVNDDDEDRAKDNNRRKSSSLYRRRLPSNRSNGTNQTSVKKNLGERLNVAICADNSWQSTCSRSGPTNYHSGRGRSVRRWLLITTIHLLLNAPDYGLRLYNIMRSTRVNTPLMDIVRLILRIFYFAQFAFNAAYLSAVVYRRNIRPPEKQTTPKTSNVNIYINHSEFPRVRVGVRDGARRSSRCHTELLRRHSADPRSLRVPDHAQLQVNQSPRLVPLPSSYSSETFKSGSFESNSQDSAVPGMPNGDNATESTVLTRRTNDMSTPMLRSRIQAPRMTD